MRPSYSEYYNSDHFLNEDYARYQRDLVEAEWKEQEEMCNKCGSWREKDIDGTVLKMDCRVCDEVEHQKWLHENM